MISAILIFIQEDISRLNKKNTEPEAIVVAIFLLTICISSARHMRHPKPDIIEIVSTSERREVEYEIEYVIEVYDGEHVNEMTSEDEGEEQEAAEDGTEKEVQAENDLSKPQMGDTTDIDVSESEPDVSEAADEMSAYYGHYRIMKFCFTQYYSALKYDCLPDQEADLLLGQIVVLEPDMLVTYDSERSLGTRGGRDAFDGNYALETYQIAHPQYRWMSFDTDLGELWWLKPDFDMDWAVEDTYFNQLDGVIAIPQLCEPYGTQYYYTMEGSDNLILFSTLTMQYFLLERCGESPEQALPELTKQEKEELLTEVYGEYQVTEFLPTKFYPALDSSRCIILPEEEAELMLGQYITLSEELFVTYDNCRLPNSVIVQRPEDEYMLEKIEIQKPEYRMERRRYDEIYGLRNDMLPDELCQQEYVEIDVYPGYEVSTSRILPQLFLMEDGRIIMYSMGEYFLLEKAEERTLKDIEVSENE